MELKILYPLPKEFPITFKFGEAPDWYIKQFGYPHNGLDIGAPENTPVYATDDGVVTYADSIPDADGCGIFITHDWGTSEYWHLSKVVAAYGDQVKKGDLIGYSGHTGFASGPHLHFGIKVAGNVVPGMRGWNDPEPYLETPAPVLCPATNPQKSYTVVQGDCLWSIAYKMLGAGYLWPQIYNLNKDIISNPSFIYAGQLLKIP